MPDRIEIVDAIAWGNLVKDWVKGAKPVPRNLTELKAQCGTSIKIPESMKAVTIVQQSEDAVLVRLPARKMVVDAEAELQATGYPLPDFYAKAFGDAAFVFTTPAQRLEFQACRIGDYAISNCV
jgi:hypothetical protein